MPPEEWERWEERMKVIEENAFPYLDMKLSWQHDNLHFSVYNKENQTIKYVNKESCHRTLVFKAVPAGVFTRIGQLTSQNINSLIAFNRPYNMCDSDEKQE